MSQSRTHRRKPIFQRKVRSVCQSCQAELPHSYHCLACNNVTCSACYEAVLARGELYSLHGGHTLIYLPGGIATLDREWVARLSCQEDPYPGRRSIQCSECQKICGVRVVLEFRSGLLLCIVCAGKQNPRLIRIVLNVEWLGEEDLEEKGPQLGKGCFSRVESRALRNGNGYVAVKVVTGCEELWKGSEVASFQNEARVYLLLRGPLFLQLLGIFKQSLVLQQVEGLNFRTKATTMGLASRFATILDVALALRAMHSRGLVHLDVKPENVLVGEGRSLLIDFGMTRYEYEEAPPLLDYRYKDPLIQKLGCFSPGSDVFSFGLLLNFAFTGTLQQNSEQKLSLLSTILPRLVHSCVEPVWVRRPTMAQVCEQLEGLGSLGQCSTDQQFMQQYERLTASPSNELIII